VARFRKETIGAGHYRTPDGDQVVDPQRLQHWADTINEMVSLGIKPPLSWGHGKGALPHAEGDGDYWRSRLVAGKITGATITPGGTLGVSIDAPGIEAGSDGSLTTLAELPDGRKVRSAVEEVSIGAMDWTDGTGRLWRDAPVHVAITPLPVWVPEGGQPPFEKAEDEPKVAHFSTASLLYRFASEGDMADEETKDPPDEGEGNAVPEVGISEVLEALASIGLTLPESTTPETLWRDIVVGAAAIAGADGAAEEPAETPVEAEGGGLGGAGGAFMSTLRDDPIGKGLIARLEADDRDKRLARLKALQGRGLTAHQAGKLRERITAVRFSTDPSGNPQRAGVDDVLDALEASLPSEEDASTRALFGTLTGLGSPTPPEGEDDRKRDEEVADGLARAGGLPARKRGA
jgi:hypothetical protein